VINRKVDIEDRNGVDQIANAPDGCFRVEESPGGTLAVPRAFR
jgi:hypothetical protein